MTQRRTDVDVVRFLALVSMYVAHVAPVPGPAHVLELSEYLTMPLFAVLIGVGAQLGARGAPGRWWWSMLVRAAVLVGLGLALERAGSQVVIVLVHLGVLVVVAGLLARLPSLVVAAVGVAAVVVGELFLGDAGTYFVGDGWTDDLRRFLWVGGPYRLLTMVLFAAVGIVLARWWVTGERRRSILLPGAVGAVLLVPAAVMLAAEQAGRIDLVPYSGTLQETVLDTLLAAGVLGVGLALGRLLERVRPLVGLLATAGAMTLTLYVLQVLWLAYDVRVLHPGARDDSWTNLGVLVAGSLVIAAAWPVVVRREPWRRGPLEGVVAGVTCLVPGARH
ncbi:hypothetical protein J2X46_002461 [Nocardioides sp. BE266]|uniref:hypothetical protein n=1 Tax=Nocardioides sp. BE266 TaxID=2817725 RepID=UPI002859A14F|nr:hypothetical protein [Nocardioides sp. BE266]MDR7253471.1 hypothetical protein [Nocardioides sp. BE266]